MIQKFKRYLTIGIVIIDLIIVIWLIDYLGQLFGFFMLGTFLGSILTSMVLVVYYTRFAAFDKSDTEYWKTIYSIRGNKILGKSVMGVMLTIALWILMLIVMKIYPVTIGLFCGVCLVSFLFFRGQDILYKLEEMKEISDQMVGAWLCNRKKGKQ